MAAVSRHLFVGATRFVLRTYNSNKETLNPLTFGQPLDSPHDMVSVSFRRKLGHKRVGTAKLLCDVYSLGPSRTICLISVSAGKKRLT
jgi:hypothetical protein